VWAARTTTDRDRKQLLRTLVTDAVLTVDRENDRAEVELFWQGDAQTRLMVKLNRRPAKRTDTPKDLVELIARLAEHSNDREIAMVLSTQGLLTATELPFTESRVAGVRERAGIPAARVRAGGDGISIRAAAVELGVSTQTIRRWVREGLLPAAQTAPHGAWRICLTDDTRAKFKPDVPTAIFSLEMAARTLGLARQTVLNQVRTGQRDAIQVVNGKRRGLRIHVADTDALC
jgi:transposase-like protein